MTEMTRISNTTRIGIALAIWAAGLALFIGAGIWNVYSYRHDARNRLIIEAGRTAAQLAGLLSLPGTRADTLRARAIVNAAMEDERIYGVKVQTRFGGVEGQRRNHLWEPIAWDDEIPENCIQGLNPVKIAGRTEGSVEVWLSPRAMKEESSQLASRERWLLFAFFLIWTLMLCLVLWQWGIFRRWLKLWHGRMTREDLDEKIDQICHPEACDKTAEPDTGVINAKAGREFQRKHPDSWLVTAGMFRQTFGHAPRLISQLYAEGEIAGLCHLGRMLEQVAPCLGAEPLLKAAREMQNALNDPDCDTRALPVEKCARILEQTLAALGCDSAPRPVADTGN